MFCLRTILLLLALLPAWATAADAHAIVTILEGDAALVRESERFALGEGVRLQPEDIVETGPKTGLLRIEFKDGRIADLGPGTAVLLAPKLASGKRERRPADLYLRQGWVKLTGAGRAKGQAGFSSPEYDVSEVEGVVVAFIDDAESFVFAETRPLKVVERRSGNAGPSLSLKGGESYWRRGADKGAVGQRPPGEMLERMPRAFRDTLPPLSDRYGAQTIQPRAQRTVDYEDLKGWLQAERAVRANFVSRWKSLANDDGFRQALIANLRAHPEWDRVLFPEKYLPKPPVAASAPAGAAGAR
ncbi:hypothetical protein M8A51_20955 [Schlegelella sp. S2-27]|uniref:FecR protein domain-containing protein n=1 Tax=Caldimonas mangrovi TaxID=2944811 RepID=A0ABT0YTD6_9BURK|nr:hypothetical protein [Caldimonas mangrovi]MCM5682005.1 hypothetical protein [Caldimonas mangrovi]